MSSVVEQGVLAALADESHVSGRAVIIARDRVETLQASRERGAFVPLAGALERLRQAEEWHRESQRRLEAHHRRAAELRR
jgi:hypothetical protein